MSSKPVFFISSTIYDFADLRSALKFYLEEQGCVVVASEFNDFNGPLDQHSYDACLKSIESADYFVLLIGTRIGGWFDERSKTSITRREYQRAYELHVAGKLKILAFVRSQVWALKEDRKEFLKYLDRASIDPAVKAAVAASPSKSVPDADFLISFLEEIGRNKETAKAAATGGPRPTGNWIYTFTAFRDVVDTLRAQVFAGVPREHAVARRLLQGELRDVLSKMLVKVKDTTGFYFERIPAFAAKYPLRADQLATSLRVDRKDWDPVLIAVLHVGMKRIPSYILNSVLSSDTFLEFDPTSGTFVEGPVHGALASLQEEIRAFSLSKGEPSIGLQAGKISLAHNGQSSLMVPAVMLVEMQSLLDRALNVVLLATAILKHLNGQPFKLPVLRPQTPLVDEVQALKDESVSFEDISNFLRRR